MLQTCLLNGPLLTRRDYRFYNEMKDRISPAFRRLWSVYVCVRVRREGGRTYKEKGAKGGHSTCFHAAFIPTSPSTPFCLLPPPPPPSRAGRSLFVLPEHVVLFALHVLKVKVAARHALVDVLDVVAGGFKVSGRVVGARGEDLARHARLLLLLL